MKRDQAQMTRNDRWCEGTEGGISPMADFVLRNDRTRICGFGGSGSSGNHGHVTGSSGVPGFEINNCHCLLKIALFEMTQRYLIEAWVCEKNWVERREGDGQCATI